MTDEKSVRNTFAQMGWAKVKTTLELNFLYVTAGGDITYVSEEVQDL